MEGLIPFIFNAMKTQRPQNAYRCLTESSSSRSYHLLLTGESAEGSSHHRSRSDFPQTSGIDYLSVSEHLTRRKNFGPAAANSNAGNDWKQRGFTSAENYQISARAKN